MENIKVTLQERSNPFEIMSAVEKILVEHGCLSIALIQRKLRIGFTHAYRIIEYLKDAGELYQDGLVYRSHRLTPLAPDAATPSDNEAALRKQVMVGFVAWLNPPCQ